MKETENQKLAREAARKIMEKQLHRGLIEDVAYCIILAAIEKGVTSAFAAEREKRE